MRSLLLLVACVACGGGSRPTKAPTLPDVPDAAPPAPPAPVVHTEDWTGTLVLVRDLRDIVLHFTETDGKWTATLDVPIAKIAGLPLSDVAVKSDGIGFRLAKNGAPQADELYTFRRNGDVASGVLVTSGQTFIAKIVKLGSGEAPHGVIARPQTPKPPFPYSSREVEITAPEDGTLAGTLTIPEGKGPFPAVLLISGSGAQERDETIFGHRPLLVIADRLTRDGIAVLRCDDRGTGKTKGKLTSLETEFGDHRAAFEFLLKQPEVDPKHVGMIGHSVGGVIAPTVAARTGKAAFIVSLAGPGVSGAELVPMQLEVTLKLQQMPEPITKAIVDSQRKVGAAIVKGKEADIKAALKQAAIDTAIAAGGSKPDDKELDPIINAKYAEVTNPWVVGFFKTDPAVVWKQFKKPVLVVIGDKDTQVPVDANFAKLAAALKGNKDVTFKKQPGLNHLYQHATTGLVDEYGQIEETFDKDTLDLVAKWVVDRAKK